jgi:hypothetical protein
MPVPHCDSFFDFGQPAEPEDNFQYLRPGPIVGPVKLLLWTKYARYFSAVQRNVSFLDHFLTFLSA